MRKIVLKILFLAFIAIGCQENKQPKTDIVQENPIRKSDFDLKTDYIDFKQKMTELDTINVFVDHSICTYQGYERLRITKKNDSILIRSEFKDYDDQKPEWKMVYEKYISENDTIWNFGKFMEMNKNRLEPDAEEYVKIEIKSGEQKLNFVTNGLVDMNRFMADYGMTMRNLYEPKERPIYGVPVITETELIINE